MMNTDSKTMLEAFEETGGRGDVLSLPLAYLKRMQAVPFERFAPIIYQLFKWFVTGDNTPLDDPLANAELEGLKVEQLQNAVRRKAFLVEQANRAKKGAAARWGTSNAHGHTEDAHGCPRAAVVCPTITKTVTINHNPNQSEGYGYAKTVVVDGSRADADAAPEPPPPPTATATEAKRRIRDIAPEVNADNYDQAAIKFYKENYVGVWSKNDRIAANRAALVVGETCNMQTMQFLINSCRELGRELFLRAVFRMDQDMNKPGGSEIENPGAVLVTRLKQLKEAVAVVGR